jgi:acyl-CoA synthetase (AMP-forming)/AMP-acid ligase II
MPDPIAGTGSATNVALVCARLAARGSDPALWDAGREVSGHDLLARATWWTTRLSDVGVAQGAVVAFTGDYCTESIALFLALAVHGAIAVPFSVAAASEQGSLAAVAGVEWWAACDGTGALRPATSPLLQHPLLAKLRADRHPGLVVFTSGSTGKPKAILHDVDRVASKFVQMRRGWRTALFLLMDHFGGFNTLLSCLAYDGVGICLPSRLPDDVCRAMTSARAELLPTTPTFLAMLIASGVWRNYDLTSLRLITYGAEPMPEATLRRLPQIFPNADLKQTYGLSELGVLRSASPDAGSLWLRVGGSGFETKVVDGVLHVRSQSNMLGYLNAPSPIDADGWMSTGDLVEERDGLLKFVGRVSEMINVGGQKVLPAEVETVLLDADNVSDATVSGARHPLLGQVVSARVSLIADEDREAAVERLRAHCRARLQKYKVPMRFEFVDIATHGTGRAKKRRFGASDSEGSDR